MTDSTQDTDVIDLTDTSYNNLNNTIVKNEVIDLQGFESASDDEIILPIKSTTTHHHNNTLPNFNFNSASDSSEALAQQLQQEEIQLAQRMYTNNNTVRYDDTGHAIQPVPADYTPVDTMQQHKIDFDELESIDPNPDIFAMFVQYNNMLFGGLLDCVEVKWSKRAKVCAGLCVYQGHGYLCSVRLSEPLLKYRPRSDLINTLLHEMIHAYLFVRMGDRDHDGHGAIFKYHMKRINHVLGTSITVYHTFHNEVRLYKTHKWRCTGPCRDREPYQGWYTSSMNRAPGPNNLWWSRHQANCTGTYVKVSEPEPKPIKPPKLKKDGSAVKKRKKGSDNANQSTDKSIDTYFKKPDTDTSSNIHTIHDTVTDSKPNKQSKKPTKSTDVKPKKTTGGSDSTHNKSPHKTNGGLQTKSRISSTTTMTIPKPKSNKPTNEPNGSSAAVATDSHNANNSNIATSKLVTSNTPTVIASDTAAKRAAWLDSISKNKT